MFASFCVVSTFTRADYFDKSLFNPVTQHFPKSITRICSVGSEKGGMSGMASGINILDIGCAF